MTERPQAATPLCSLPAARFDMNDVSALGWQGKYKHDSPEVAALRDELARSAGIAVCDTVCVCVCARARERAPAPAPRPPIPHTKVTRPRGHRAWRSSTPRRRASLRGPRESSTETAS